MLATLIGWPSSISAASRRPSLSVGCGCRVPARSAGEAISSTARAPQAAQLGGPRPDGLHAHDPICGGVHHQPGESLPGSRVAALPDADRGKLATRTSMPSRRAASSLRPTLAISGIRRRPRVA